MTIASNTFSYSFGHLPHQAMWNLHFPTHFIPCFSFSHIHIKKSHFIHINKQLNTRTLTFIQVEKNLVVKKRKFNIFFIFIFNKNFLTFSFVVEWFKSATYILSVYVIQLKYDERKTIEKWIIITLFYLRNSKTITFEATFIKMYKIESKNLK